MIKYLISTRLVQVIVGLLLTLLFVLDLASTNSILKPVVQRIDFLLYDVRLRASIGERPESAHNIVIIDVDERSLREQGRWPWSRERIGEMVSNLYGEGAVVVAFDVVFAEPQPSPVEQILADGQISGQVLSELAGIQSHFDYDQRFADSLGTDTILGYFFRDKEDLSVGALPEPIIRLDDDRVGQIAIKQALSYSSNFSVLNQAALSSGFLSTFSDEDGVVRRSPMVLRYGNDLYASLSLEVARQYLFADEIRLQTAMQGETEVLEAIWLDKNKIPTDAIGQALIPFTSERFRYIAASDVLEQKVEAGALENAIVLIGTSALGLADLRTTPVMQQFPGVEVHAILLEAILNSIGDKNYFYSRPDLENWITISIILFVGVLLSVLQPRLGPMRQIILFAVVASAGGFFNWWMWVHESVDFQISPLLFLNVLLSAIFITLGFIKESSQREEIKGMFGQYVAEAHIDQLLDEGVKGRSRFDGESREMTVLFCDIRSFTTISETLSAAELKQFLNQYFTPITKIIFDTNGTIDKYVGDMVMAFWNAPLDDRNHVENAIEAALTMLECTEQLKPVFREQGFPEVNIGIGLNTGMMNVGDMGSTYRRAYTVLGDAVNLGARLEGVTKFYGAKCLIGEQTQAQAKNYHVRLVDRIRVKGKNEPIYVYEPLALLEQTSDEQREEVASYHFALSCYYRQQWQQALDIFLELSVQNSDCYIYQMYIERISDMRIQTLEADWNGVYVHTTK